MRRNHFWGLLLIVVGLAFIGRRILNIDISISTVILSFILIFWGLSMVMGHSSHREEEKKTFKGGDSNFSNYKGDYKGNFKKDVIFSSRDIYSDGSEGKFDIIFSNCTIDLTSITIPVVSRTIKIDVVFSSALIRINPNIPAKIKVDSAFSSTRLPDNSITSFGGHTYVTAGYREDAPCYNIKIDSVFSDTKVIQ